MSGYELISADSHVIEPADLFERRFPAGLRDRAPRLGPLNGGSAWFVDGADPIPLPVSAATGSGYRALRNDAGELRRAISFEEVLPGLYDPVERLRMQNADSVDAEVLYPFPGLWDEIKSLEDTQLALACTRAYNDWIAEFSSHSPDRLIGLGKIPSTSLEDAESELVRCVDDLHLRGVVLDTWPGGSAVVGDPSDGRFWSTVNEAQVPVSIHWALGPYAVTAPSSGVAAGLTPPMADVARPLVMTGLFDRCPNVRVVFAHGDAGWAFRWLEGMDTSYLRTSHVLPDSKRLPEGAFPSEYVRRHFWFTFHHDRTAVRNRGKLGGAHLMWASSLPLDSANWPDNRQQAMRVSDEVPAEERHALLAGNTARLYRLPGYEQGFAREEIESFDKLVHL
jgi:predicted TIM-barrel fold metal-dependent hydrolase